jgi:6-phosphofructokinase 2
MKRIVTLTMNPAIDANSSVPHVSAEKKLRCTEPTHEPGGGGINVSCAIQILGAQSLALYAAGGAFGDLLRSLLDAKGLHHRHVPVKGTTRENITVLEEASNTQYRFIMPGPTLSPEEWNGCLDVISSLSPRPDFIVASGSLPPGVPRDFYARTARLAQDMGAKLILDTRGQALLEAVRQGVYMVKPNMRELQEFARREIEDEPLQEQTAMEMVESESCQVVVVSLGRAGALLTSRDGCRRLRAPAVPVKSKVGAGDSMVAGIVLSLARGTSLEEAVLFGVAAGRAAVMTPGTQLCRKEDTERLFARLHDE